MEAEEQLKFAAERVGLARNRKERNDNVILKYENELSKLKEQVENIQIANNELLNAEKSISQKHESSKDTLSQTQNSIQIEKIKI